MGTFSRPAIRTAWTSGSISSTRGLARVGALQAWAPLTQAAVAEVVAVVAAVAAGAWRAAFASCDARPSTTLGPRRAWAGVISSVPLEPLAVCRLRMNGM